MTNNNPRQTRKGVINMTISNALETVKRYCLAHDCESCSLSELDDDRKRCSLKLRTPIRWDCDKVTNESNRNDIEDSIVWLMTEFCITKEQATTIYHLLHITINAFKEI